MNKEDLKTYLLVGLTIAICVLILIKGCSEPFNNASIITPNDTITTKSDTIYFRDTLVKFNTITKFKYITVTKFDTVKEGMSLDNLHFTRVYNDSLVDTNLTIYSKVKAFGLLDELDLSYRLKMHPKTITEYIVTTVNHTEIKNPNLSIYTGIELGGNSTQFNLSPFVFVGFNKTSISYRYEVIHATHNVSIGYNLFNSKK